MEQIAQNQVIVEGTVVGRWTLDGDTCYRLAVRRGRGVPANPDGKNFDAITVRLNYFLAQQAGEFQRGSTVRVQGLLQQRDAQESLQRVVERLIADDATKAAFLARFDGDLLRLRLSRSEIEVVVFGWDLVSPPRPPRAKIAPASSTTTTDSAAKVEKPRKATRVAPAPEDSAAEEAAAQAQ